MCTRMVDSTHLRVPHELVLPPEGDVLVVAAGSEHLLVGVHGEPPELAAVAEHDLVEAALQRPLQDVVARGAHVDVAVVAARPLRVERAHTTRRLGQLGNRLEERKGFVRGLGANHVDTTSTTLET